MDPEIQWTHKGQFGLCPVYLAQIESVRGPIMAPRHWTLVPLLHLSEILYMVYFTLRGVVDMDYEPEWVIKVTGEL